MFSTIKQIISKYREDLKKIDSFKKLKNFLNKTKKSFNLKRIKHFFKNIGKKISSYWKRVLSFIESLAGYDISYVTLYAFSTENWKRSSEEVSTLMNLLCEFLD